MRNRRGVAMIAALWLVVAIAVVALQFSLDAKERRQLGLAAADRGIARGVAHGAVAMLQAQLEAALRLVSQNAQALAGTRAGDAWMGADSVYSGTYTIDNSDVQVQVLDLGMKVNINTAIPDQLRAYLGFVMGDAMKADKIAAAIVDWRDVDDNPVTNGAEIDQYVKAGALATPANGPFQQVEDLLNVMNMTPELYALIAPDLTVYGTGQINLNTAPIQVLRSIPGMTDQAVGLILGARTRGLRIASVAQIVPGSGGRGNALATVQLQMLNRLATVTSANLQLVVLARGSTWGRQERRTALLQRAGTNVTLVWEQ